MTTDSQYDSIKKNPQLRAVFWVLFSVAVLLLVYILRFYFWPALFALLVFIILNPAFLILNRQFPNRRNLSATALILAALILFIIPIVLLLIALSQEAMRASMLVQKNLQMDNIKAFIQKQEPIFSYFREFGIAPGEIISKIALFLQKSTDMVVERITSLITSSLGFGFDLILMIIILFFLLKEGDRIAKAFYEILPFPEELEKQIAKRTAQVIRYVFYGNLAIMIMQGFVIFLIFVIFQIPSPLLWSVVAGLVSVIPIISTSIVWLPASLFLLLTDQMTGGILLGILSLAAAQILENIIKPKILDKKLNIHPLVLFFALFGGLQSMGLVGLILGPVIITLFVSFIEAYRVIEEFTPQEIKEKRKQDKQQLEKEKISEVTLAKEKRSRLKTNLNFPLKADRKSPSEK